VKLAIERLESKLQALEPLQLPFHWTLTGTRAAPEDEWRPVVIRMVQLVKEYLDPCHTRPLKRCTHVRPSHGGAIGMDSWFHDACRAAGWLPRVYPVKRDEWRMYGGHAGAMRNHRMLVAERPHLCTALVHNASRGATGCANEALTLGYPVLRITEEELRIPLHPG
jgi:hypothetical protein